MTHPKGFEVGCLGEEGWLKTIRKREGASEENLEARQGGW